MEKQYKDLSEEAQIYKVLSHPARLAILKLLAESSNCVNMDLTDNLPIGRTTVNQHLEVLKKSGFLKWHQESNRTYYCLNREKVQKSREIISNYFDLIDNDSIIECK